MFYKMFPQRYIQPIEVRTRGKRVREVADREDVPDARDSYAAASQNNYARALDRANPDPYDKLDKHIMKTLWKKNDPSQKDRLTALLLKHAAEQREEQGARKLRLIDKSMQNEALQKDFQALSAADKRRARDAIPKEFMAEEDPPVPLWAIQEAEEMDRLYKLPYDELDDIPDGTPIDPTLELRSMRPDLFNGKILRQLYAESKGKDKSLFIRKLKRKANLLAARRALQQDGMRSVGRQMSRAADGSLIPSIHGEMEDMDAPFRKQIRRIMGFGKKR